MEVEKKIETTENIFDLTKLVPHQNEEELKKEVTITSISDRDKLLQNYIEIPREQWESISQMTHMRYLRSDGNFRKGGFVKNIIIGSYGARKGKQCFQLASNASYKSTNWQVCFDDLDKVWKRVNDKNAQNNTSGTSGTSVASGASSEKLSAIQSTFTSHDATIEYLKRMVEQLKIDVVNEQTEKQRIINLIKKLHHIRHKPQQAE
jgi:hypothetical protein